MTYDAYGADKIAATTAPITPPKSREGLVADWHDSVWMGAPLSGGEAVPYTVQELLDFPGPIYVGSFHLDQPSPSSNAQVLRDPELRRAFAQRETYMFPEYQTKALLIRRGFCTTSKDGKKTAKTEKSAVCWRDEINARFAKYDALPDDDKKNCTPLSFPRFKNNPSEPPDGRLVSKIRRKMTDRIRPIDAGNDKFGLSMVDEVLAAYEAEWNAATTAPTSPSEHDVRKGNTPAQKKARFDKLCRDASSKDHRPGTSPISRWAIGTIVSASDSDWNPAKYGWRMVERVAQLQEHKRRSSKRNYDDYRGASELGSCLRKLHYLKKPGYDETARGPSYDDKLAHELFDFTKKYLSERSRSERGNDRAELIYERELVTA